MNRGPSWLLFSILFTNFTVNGSKKEDKDQESIQSSTTPTQDVR